MNEITAGQGRPGVAVHHSPNAQGSTQSGENASENKEALNERTAHSAVLSASKRKNQHHNHGVDKSTIVDDLAGHKPQTQKSSGLNSTSETQQSEKSKRDQQGGGNDSGGFSQAEASDPAHELADAKPACFHDLVKSLQALTKEDCRYVLDNASFDPGQALRNLWQPDAHKRLEAAASSVKAYEKQVTAKIQSFKSFEAFEAFLNAPQLETEDKILADTIKAAANGFAGSRQQAKVQGFSNADDIAKEDLKSLYHFFQSEDHQVRRSQKRVARLITKDFLVKLLETELKTKKFSYRLNVAFKFSRVQRVNPFEQLRKSTLGKLGDDKELAKKASEFKETTEKNAKSLKAQIKHSVLGFLNIFLDGFTSIISDLNKKLGANISQQKVPAFVGGIAK